MKRALQALKVSPDPYDRAKIVSGEITATIRVGHRDYRVGLLQLCCPREPWAVECDIVSVRPTTGHDITADELTTAGYQSLDEMVQRMRRFNPSFSLDDEVTVISWTKVRGKFVDNPDAHIAHLATLRF